MATEKDTITREVCADAAMPPRVKIPRQAGLITHDHATRFVAALIEEIRRADERRAIRGPQDIRDVMFSAVFEALTAAEAVAFNVEFNCPSAEALSVERARDGVILAALVEHLLQSGALVAAAKHALEVATEEITTEPERHLTDPEIVALVLCSDVCCGDKRKHLPVGEQERRAFHVALCVACGGRTSVIADVMHIASEAAKGREVPS